MADAAASGRSSCSGSAMDDELCSCGNRNHFPKYRERAIANWKGVGNLSRLSRFKGLHLTVRPGLDQCNGEPASLSTRDTASSEDRQPGRSPKRHGISRRTSSIFATDRRKPSIELRKHEPLANDSGLAFEEFQFDSWLPGKCFDVLSQRSRMRGDPELR
jgi:hypothetical protein